MINGHMVFSRLICIGPMEKYLKVKNNGTSVACGGISNVNISNPKIKFFPKNLNLANPYPAKVETTTWEIAIAPEKATEFSNDFG
jgi:hypothetical protein